MKPSTLTLAFAAFAAAVPLSYVISVTDNEIPLLEHQTPSRIISDKPVPNYDDSRIAHHPDKRLVANYRAYFKTLVDNEPEALRDFQTEDYTMIDIPFGVVNTDRDTYYLMNKAFITISADYKVTGLSLDGSSEPGSFSIFECVVEFRLTMDPPPGVAETLPVGAKAGDRVAMILLSTIWWTEEGKITRELEYGSLVWKDFSLEPFLKGRKNGVVKNK